MTDVYPRIETGDTAPANLPRWLDMAPEKIGVLPTLSNPALRRHGQEMTASVASMKLSEIEDKNQPKFRITLRFLWSTCCTAAGT